MSSRLRWWRLRYFQEGFRQRFLVLRVFKQTFTGKPPFVVHSHAATFEIMNGKRPGRPVTLRHEGLWEITTRSWSKIPGERPTAFGLVKFFRKS